MSPVRTSKGHSKTDRRSPSTSDPTYTDEETLFLKALVEYRQRNHRQFLTNGEILAILKALGYRRVAEPTELPTWPLKTEDLMGTGS